MKTTTTFAIKANVAGLLLTFLFSLAFGPLFYSLMTNVAFAGSSALVFAFAGMYFATKALLKNTKFGPEDRAVALERTWQIAVAIGVALFLIDLRTEVAMGWTWTAFSLLSIAAQVAAVKVLSAQK